MGVLITGTPAFNNAAFGSAVTISSYTVPADAKLMIVDVVWGLDQTVSTAVFNTSESLTRLDGAVISGVAVDRWYRINPTPTTANVVVTMSGAVSQRLRAIVKTYSGVNTGAPLGQVFKDTGTISPDPPPILNVTDSVVGDLVDDALATDDLDVTVDGSQTGIWEDATNGAPLGAGSTKAGAAGTVTMQWTGLANFSVFSYLATAIKAAPTARSQGVLRPRPFAPGIAR